MIDFGVLGEKNLIEQAEDLLISCLKLHHKQKYSVTRKDGYRINITKLGKSSQKTIKKHKKSIMKLRKQGYSYVQIRKKLHISPTIINSVVKKYNMQGQYRKN